MSASRAVRNTMMFGEPFPTRSHFCVVAWIAQERGEQEVAGLLYKEARKVPAQSDRFAPQKPNPKESFREGLEREVALTMLHQAIGGFGAPSRIPKPALSRVELLERFEMLDKKFSKHPEAVFIKEANFLKALLPKKQGRNSEDYFEDLAGKTVRKVRSIGNYQNKSLCMMGK